MNTVTLPGQPADAILTPTDRALQPRPADRRPGPPQPLPAPDHRTLESHRSTINRAALALPGPLHVVLYALTGPGRAASDDLAAARSYAQAQRLIVATPPLVDALDGHDIGTGGENPLLRRGYARALQMLADPDCPVRGLVAVSRTAITPADRVYQDQLTWYAAHGAGLWLVRGENEI